MTTPTACFACGNELPPQMAIPVHLAALQYQINLLAWLHNELVHQLQQFMAQAIGATNTSALTEQAHDQAVRARAARIARIRADQAATTGP